MESKRWIAGEPRASATLDLELAGRAARYGDGVFVTLAAEGGRLLEADAQLERLAFSCCRVGLAVPDAVASVAAVLEVLESIGAPARQEFVVRVQVSAAESERGYARAAEGSSGAASWEMVEVSRPPIPRRCMAAIAAPDLGLPAPPLPDIKSCNALPHVLAAREASRLGVHELIRLTGDRVAEAAAANVFWLREGVLFTPDASLPIYPGVTRQLVIETAQSAGLEVEIGEHGRDSIAAAAALFLTNATRGIERVAELDGASLSWPAELAALAEEVRDERLRRAAQL